MDCKTARLLLALGPTDWTELDEGEANALESHLSECAQCAAVAHAERQADERLREAMRDLSVPALPRERILRDIRRREKRVFRRRLTKSAAAAALIIAVGFGSWSWTRSHRPIVDPIEDAEVQARRRGASVEFVQERFAEWGVKAPMPSRLNYACFQDGVMEEYRGRSVPSLLFIRGGNWAKVRVLTDSKFNLTALDNSEAGTGGIKVLIERSDEDPNVVYEIIFTGESLDWLMEQSSPAA